MKHNTRRSLVSDMSSRNKGDQPLSPPETPSPPFSNKTIVDHRNRTDPVAVSGKRCPTLPWDKAEEIALPRISPSKDPGKMNSDPNVPDLAASMNSFVNLEVKDGEKHAPEESGHRGVDDAMRGDHGWRARQATESNDCDSSKCSAEPRIQQDKGQASSVHKGPSSTACSKYSVLERHKVCSAVLAIFAALWSGLLFNECVWWRQLHVSYRLSLFMVLLWGLPGSCLLCIWYIHMQRAWESNRRKKRNDSPLTLNRSAAQLEDEPAQLRLIQEQRAAPCWNILKGLCGFTVGGVMKTCAYIWPLLYTSTYASDNFVGQPPLFGPAPQGATIGILGYPPRAGGVMANSFSMTPGVQLVLSLGADVARLVGVWFVFNAFEKGHAADGMLIESPPSRSGIFGRNRSTLLLLIAVPLASVSLQKTFWSSWCLQLFDGQMPLKKSDALSFAGLFSRSHSALLAAAAGLTGALVVVAFQRVLSAHIGKKSKVLGLVASLALFCSFIIDAFAATACSGAFNSFYAAFTLHLEGDFAFKPLAAASELAQALALLCITFSASLSGLDRYA